MTELYIGLISGTSVDAVDAALVDLSDPEQPVLLGTHGLAPSAALRDRLLAAAMDSETVSLRELGQLDQLVAEWFARAANELLEAQPGHLREQVRAIGSHGQTLYHGADATPPFTMQIGDPSRIAHLTGIPVVGYFRQADMAAGGQGAPLATAYHAAYFRDAEEHRCVLNLGGIANLTDLPARSSQRPITGFDTGPSNGLLDAWIRLHRQQKQDDEGRWGRQGRLNEELLSVLLDEEYFQLPPPKSTGREYFNLKWMQHQAGGLLDILSAEDVMRSLYGNRG